MPDYSDLRASLAKAKAVPEGHAGRLSTRLSAEPVVASTLRTSAARPYASLPVRS